MSFADLVKKDTEIGQHINEIKAGLDLTTAWLEKNGHSGPQMSVDEIEEIPFVKSPIIPDMLLSNYDMRIFDQPPTGEAKLKKLALVAPITERDKQLVVNLGPGRMDLPYDSDDYQHQDAIWFLGQSFAHGDRDNIVHYHRVFSDGAGRHIRALEQIQASLRGILLKKAKLSVSVFFSNTGRDSVVMKPFMGLQIDNPDLKGKPIILSTIPSGSNARSPSATSVNTQPLLPESSPVPYFSLAPNESKTLHLVSLDPLGDDAAKFVEIYSTGILKCKVIAFTNSADRFESPMSNFGAHISDSDREQLNAMLKTH